MESSEDDDNTIMRTRKRLHSVFDTDDTSSSSSSDEFERAPDCLDDLSDIPCKPSSANDAAKADSSNKTEGNLSDTSEDLSVEYYDFSSILKSQEELKTVAKQMAEYTEKHKHEVPPPKPKESTPKTPKIRSKRDQESAKTKSPVRATTENMDIGELLRVGEKVEKKVEGKKNKEAGSRSKKKPVLDESLDDDMVIVTDGSESEDEDATSPQGVEITIALPSLHLQRKKDRDLRTQIELARRYNEARRGYQLVLHKVTLLGNLSFGFSLNRLANCEELQALALSIIPSKSFYPPRLATVGYAGKITTWFQKNFPNDDSQSTVSLDIITNDFSRKKSSSVISMVVMFVAMCRQLGLKCRLLVSLRPCSMKPPSSEAMKIPKEAVDDEDDLFDESLPKKHKPSTSSGKSTKKKSNPEKPSKNGKTTKKKKKEKTPPKERENPSKKKRVVQGKSTPKKKANRKVVSSDESEEETNTKNSVQKTGMDYWAEVYIESDGAWVPADVVRAQVNNIPAISSGVTKPMRYVVAWNSDDTVKDLTRRYSPHWLTTTPKQRVDPAWWKEALAPWAPRKTKMEKLENEKLDKEEAACPIPATINECKNHPFYALKRHLLKFEAIFPADAVPIGFLRGEAVYSRVCVTELHTKEMWMRQGKAVRVKEEPYKIVKARPKWDKVNSTMVKDLPLPLFGYWQVDDYIAPPAVDGKVPKNDYGNVELYRPSMLPAGTVHLQVPGMAKVAKKLGIDFAAAVVGWDYHGGSSHPQIDGVVVCEEFQDTLLDAWNADIDQMAEKRKSKAHIRAVKNWKKLIRSVIIRRRLERKYKLDLSNVKTK